MTKSQLSTILIISTFVLFQFTGLSHAGNPYNEQIGMSLTQNYSMLAYNITAIPQNNQDGYSGPAYLLNGYSNTGYWYQANFGYGSGSFFLQDNVYAPCSASCTPVDNRAFSFSKPINPGDKVLVEMYFQSGRFIISAKDWNNSATASINYTSNGSTEFLGSPNSAFIKNGFTGLMTEWYFNHPFYGSQEKVTYQPYKIQPSAVYFWIQEGGGSPPMQLFNETSAYPAPVSSTPYRMSLNNATETYQNGVFITGSINPPAYTSTSTSTAPTTTSTSTMSYTTSSTIAATSTECPIAPTTGQCSCTNGYTWNGTGCQQNSRCPGGIYNNSTNICYVTSTSTINSGSSASLELTQSQSFMIIEALVVLVVIFLIMASLKVKQRGTRAR